MSVILCTAGYDHTIRFWEALSGICSRTIPHPESQVNRLCISPDKRFLAAAGHHTVKLFDIKSSNPNAILTFDGHANNITGVAFHCEGKWMVTSSEDGTVKIWDTRTGSVQRNYNHGSPVNDVVIHPNQGELISCDRAGNVRVWDLSENKCSHQLIPEEDVSVASVTVASDGSMLCAGNNTGNVYVWDIHNKADLTQLVPVCKFTAHNTYITRVLLSPDIRLLATCSADHTARIWKVRPDRSGQSDTSASVSNTASPSASNPSLSNPSMNGSGTSPGPRSRGGSTQQSGGPTGGPGTQPMVNPNAHFSPSAADEKQQMQALQNLPAGQSNEPGAFPLETTLQGHQRWVWDCAFSADSAYLVTACSDHFARLWELNTESIIRQYNGHHRGAVCVALNDTALT